MGKVDIFVDGVEPMMGWAHSGETPEFAPSWPAQRVSRGFDSLVVQRQAPRSRAAIRAILERIAAGNCRRSRGR